MCLRPAANIQIVVDTQTVIDTAENLSGHHLQGMTSLHVPVSGRNDLIVTIKQISGAYSSHSLCNKNAVEAPVRIYNNDRREILPKLAAVGAANEHKQHRHANQHRKYIDLNTILSQGKVTSIRYVPY